MTTTAPALSLLAAFLVGNVSLFAKAPWPTPLTPEQVQALQAQQALRNKWMAASSPEQMFDRFVDPAFWDAPADWSRWLVYSRTGDSTVYHTWKGAPVFGVDAGEVRAHVQAEASGTGMLQLVEVIYFEAGHAAARALDNGQAGAAGKAEAERIFREANAALLKALDSRFGPGRMVSVGQTQALRTMVREYSREGLVLRLTSDPGQLIQLTIQRNTTATHKLTGMATPSPTPTPWNAHPGWGSATPGAGTTRGAEAHANVKDLPNGDRIIENIPMSVQGGRQYCAVGTVAMIANYYHINVNIDELAAKAGYTMGDVSAAHLGPVFQAVATEGRLRFTQEGHMGHASIMAQIDRGIPVIVWRYVSDGQFLRIWSETKRCNEDPEAQLSPVSMTRKDWPTASGFRHASLITGYNKARGEFLLTESYGEACRNERIRVEELTATAYNVLTFVP